MLPFQTDTFSPDDPLHLKRVRVGQRLADLYLGATAYLVDGERGVVVGDGGLSPRGPWLAYPLPESYGEGRVEAIRSFEAVWAQASEWIRPALN